MPVVDKEGNEVWVGQNLKILSDNNDPNNVVGFLAVVRDITSKKKTEQRIRIQNLELEQRNAEIARKSQALEVSNTELFKAQDEIRAINEELMTINVNLEEIVEERTKNS